MAALLELLTLRDVLIGFAPGLLWLVWFWRKDAFEPEPKLALARVFALGCAAAVGVVVLRPRLETWLPAEEGLGLDLADAFLVTALTEELLKLAAFALGALWHREWDEPMDGIVYGTAAALGFASLENAVFLATSDSATLVLARAFTANLAHVAFTGGMAFFIGLGKLRGRAVSCWTVGIVLAVGLHGVYDLFLFSLAEWNALALLGVLPLSLALLGLKMRWAQARSPHRPAAVAALSAEREAA